MSAFGIFALILTTAYIIYFAVTISRDVIAGRKKAEDSPESETFDISSSAQDESGATNKGKTDNILHEESVAVFETEDGGFRVGDIEFETLFEPTVTPAIASHLVSEASLTEEERHEVMIEESDEVEEIISNLTLGCEDQSGQFEYEEQISSDDMETYMCNMQDIGNSHLVNKSGVAAEESLESEADDGLDEHIEEEVITADQPEERDWM